MCNIAEMPPSPLPTICRRILCLLVRQYPVFPGFVFSLVVRIFMDTHSCHFLQGQSEYVWTYRSPDELRKLSPDPLHHVPAGLSSVQMAVTHEPVLPRKRKDPSHDRKVTFTTDYTEHGSPTREVRPRIGTQTNVYLKPFPGKGNQKIWRNALLMHDVWTIPWAVFIR